MIDIIIPTYKNKQGLRKTLNSIDTNLLMQFDITVIDDKSDMDYSDIEQEYPYITMLYNNENIGPGNTRQKGIESTHNPYIMFIDTGDYFFSNSIQRTIISEVSQHKDIIMFFWQYLQGNAKSTDKSNRLHGRVYSRKFLENWNITFCPESSFINEDIGFNRVCRLIARENDFKILSYDTPAIVYTTDVNSLTHKNNNEYFYKKQNKGLALNMIHAVKILEQNYIRPAAILEEINAIMGSLYYTFLCTRYDRPEFIQEAWEGARLFYTDCFCHYDNTPDLISGGYGIYAQRIYLRAKKWKNFKSPNYSRFLKDLESYSLVPSWYII